MSEFPLKFKIMLCASDTRSQHTILATTCMMASNFHKIGTNETGNTGLCFNSQIKSFNNHFGVRQHVCTMIMDHMSNLCKVVMCRMCLFWSLNFLCCYPKVKVTRNVFEVDVKTFSKHISKTILCSKELNIVRSRAIFVI